MPRASGETERAQLQVTEERDGWNVTAGDFRIRVPREGEDLLSACERDGKEMIRSVRPVLRLAHASETEETENGRKICVTRTETAELPGVIRSRTLETAGPLEAVFRFDGVHLEEGAEKMPFHAQQEAIGPIDEVRPNGVPVRAMTEADMAASPRRLMVGVQIRRTPSYSAGRGLCFLARLKSSSVRL